MAAEMSNQLKEKVIPTLVKLLEHQYQVQIEYEIEKPKLQEDKTA